MGERAKCIDVNISFYILISNDFRLFCHLCLANFLSQYINCVGFNVYELTLFKELVFGPALNGLAGSGSEVQLI